MRALVTVALVAGALLAPAAAALPTPGLFCDTAETLTGRVFPEPETTNDFVSYEEGLCGLKLLAERYPDRVEFVPLGLSVGWKNAATGAQDRFEVFVVEVTNEKSAVPPDEKRKIVFQLSIHGNEKGGREGGLRVIEDFARDLGLAADRPDLVAMLDEFVLVFVFPNPDGWVHEELQYRMDCADYFVTVPHPDGCMDSQNFVRVNGNGVDLNRETPTRGWYYEEYTALSEPESVVVTNHLLNYTNVVLASDLHGMLQPANADLPIGPFNPLDVDAQHFAPPSKGNFVLTMLPAGRQSPDEMATTTALAALIKERLNADPYFAEWNAMPRPLGVWGGEYNDWGTVWDTLSYTDSGFTSDWYAQDHGLDAPGVDFEYSYNHVTFDNYYPGLAQRLNMYHVHTTRVIVAAFMDMAANPVQPTVDAQGRDTAVLENPVLVTNRDNEGEARGLSGWALENPHDDRYDLAHAEYEARPQAYWEDLAPHVANGRLDVLGVADLAARLAAYDNLVVAGSAWDGLAADRAALDAVRAWVEAGGNLVVTDDALQVFDAWGLGKAEAVTAYAAYSDIRDREHDLVAGVRGIARQLVEPVPLGYEMGEIPVWRVDGVDAEVVGTIEDVPNLGRAKLGAGSVVFVGAFLPDPTEAFYHPYGLDSYATTYTANLVLTNALGWSSGVEEVDPLAIAPATEAPADVPGFGLVAAFAAAGAVAAALRRRD